MEFQTRVTPEAGELLEKVDTVIFDVDGVLLDVSASIRAVNLLVIPAYLNRLPGWTAPETLLDTEDIERFKRAGGFNDDWDLSCALALLYLVKSARYASKDAAFLHHLPPTVEQYTHAIARRGGWLRNAEAYLRDQFSPDELATAYGQYDSSLIARLFQEMWAGDLCPRLYRFQPMYYPGPGKCVLDRPLLDRSLIPPGKRLGVLTGRTRHEADFALELVGLKPLIPLPEQGMTRDEGNQKPDPDGLRRLVRQLDCRVALYVGDAIDDLRTVLNFRQLPEAKTVTVLSAQVLSGTVGPEAVSLFAPADLVAADVNAVLRALP
jgi:HAD superfamily phosphatase